MSLSSQVTDSSAPPTGRLYTSSFPEDLGDVRRQEVVSLTLCVPSASKQQKNEASMKAPKPAVPLTASRGSTESVP